MKKKLLCILLTVALMLGMINGVTFDVGAASSDIPNGYTPIYTIEDLYGINNDLEGKYILMNDIDMSETAPGGDWDSGNGWTAIGVCGGNWTNDEWFTGTFDGNGFKIKNLNIYGDVKDVHIGLFGRVQGTIQNVGLEDVKVNVSLNSQGAVGAIAASMMLGKVNNCYVTGEISVNTNDYSCEIGSIAGVNHRGKIKNCYADTEIEVIGVEPTNPDDYYSETSSYVGGISSGLSQIERSLSEYAGDIVNCYYVGSIIAENASVAMIENDYEYNEDRVEENCFYLTGNGSDSKAKKLTKAQMKSAKCFTGFDFSDTWVIDKYSSYPYPQLRNCMQVRTTSIELLSLPDKISYTTADKLDLSGSQLKINYEDGYSETVALEESMMTYKMTVGKQLVYVEYNGCSAEFEIEVKPVPESLKITAQKTKLKIRATFTYKVKYTGTGKVTFTSSKPSVLMIGKTTGKAVAKKAGTAVITIKAGKLVKKIKVKVVK